MVTETFKAHPYSTCVQMTAGQQDMSCRDIQGQPGQVDPPLMGAWGSSPNRVLGPDFLRELSFHVTPHLACHQHSRFLIPEWWFCQAGPSASLTLEILLSLGVLLCKHRALHKQPIKGESGVGLWLLKHPQTCLLSGVAPTNILSGQQPKSMVVSSAD